MAVSNEPLAPISAPVLRSHRHCHPHHPLLLLLLLFSLLLPPVARAAVLKRSWTTQPWCRSVEAPHWPFAYQKHAVQTLEWKGRENPSAQDVRHECVALGVQSKCHRCAVIACADSATCAYQLQGVDWDALPANIPTVSDVPWAVGGTHRYDYGGASHLCMFLSSGHCLSPFVDDYRNCSVRCWGTNSQSIGMSTNPTRGER